MVLCHQRTGQLCGTLHGLFRDNVHAIPDNAAHLNADRISVPAVVVIASAAFPAAMPCRVAVLYALHDYFRIHEIMCACVQTALTREIIRVILCRIAVAGRKVQANPVDWELSALAVVSFITLLKWNTHLLTLLFRYGVGQRRFGIRNARRRRVNEHA